MKSETKKQSITWLGTCMSGNTFSDTMLMSPENHENTKIIDLRVTNKS
jgi:hypothetical protein